MLTMRPPAHLKQNFSRLSQGSGKRRATLVQWIVLSFLTALPGVAVDLHIYVEGGSDKGNIHIALSNSLENYRSLVHGDGDPFKSKILKSEAKGICYVFKDIEPGEYAALVYHDENANGKFDKKLWPLEKYGFSNNTRVKFRAPKWKEVKFKIESDSKTIKIKLYQYSLF